MELIPLGPDLFHADGRTYRYDEATSPFSILPTRLKIRAGNCGRGYRQAVVSFSSSYRLWEATWNRPEALTFLQPFP